MRCISCGYLWVTFWPNISQQKNISTRISKTKSRTKIKLKTCFFRTTCIVTSVASSIHYNGIFPECNANFNYFHGSSAILKIILEILKRHFRIFHFVLIKYTESQCVSNYFKLCNNNIDYISTYWKHLICLKPFGDLRSEWHVPYSHMFMIHCLRGNISSRYSSNSEASASELQEHLEKLFPR